MGNPNPDRQFYDHASGTEVTASNGVFDVPAWRASLLEIGESKEQTRNGQSHTRVYDPDSAIILKKILVELTKMNTHLEILTGESI